MHALGKGGHPEHKCAVSGRGEPKGVHVARCLGCLISSVTQNMARGRLRERIGIPSVHLTTYMELGFQHQGSVGLYPTLYCTLGAQFEIGK